MSAGPSRSLIAWELGLHGSSSSRGPLNLQLVFSSSRAQVSPPGKKKSHTCWILSKAPPARRLLLGGCDSHSHSSHCRAHWVWQVPRATCYLPASSCWAQLCLCVYCCLLSVCLSVPVSPRLPFPCELQVFPSGAFSPPWLWVQTSPSTALDTVYDPLNLYCLHRGSTGHTCSITQVPLGAGQPCCLQADSPAASIPVHPSLLPSLHTLHGTKGPG